MSKTCKQSGTRWGSLLVAAALTGAATVHGASSTSPTRTESLTVNDPRPLAAVADQLENRFGIPITYEDPPYLHSSEIADLRSEPAAKGHVERDHPTWIPRFGRIELSYVVSGGENQIDDVAAALEQAIQVHADNGNAGSFRLDRQGEALSLIPIAAKGADGRVAPIKPVLDTEVRLPAGARPGRDFLELIMDELNRKSGFKINHGWATGIVRSVESTGVPEPARSALRRLLEAQPIKLTWRLFYDPPMREYFLSIVPAAH